MSFIINYICAYILYTPDILYYKWNQIIFFGDATFCLDDDNACDPLVYSKGSSSNNLFSITISGISHKSNESGLEPWTLCDL